MSLRPWLVLGFVCCLPLGVLAQQRANLQTQIDSIHRLPWKRERARDVAGTADKLAELHFLTSRADSALFYNEEVFRLAAATQSDTLWGMAYRGKSLTLTQSGQVDAGLAYADTALLYFRKAGHLRYQYLTLRNLGYQYARRGDCVRSLATNRATDSLQRELELGVVDRLRFSNAYAASLDKCRFYELVPGVIKEVLPEARELGDPLLLASFLNRLVTAYRGMGELDSALVYVRRYGDLLPVMKNPSQISSYYTNAGNVYYDRGEKERAREMFELGLIHARSYGTPYSVHVKSINLGMLEQEAGNYPRAIELLEAGRTYFEQSNELDALLEIYPNLALAYAGANRYELAYRNAMEAKSLSDSLSKVFYDNSLSEKAALQEADRTRYELAMTRLENAEQHARNQARMRLLLLLFGGSIAVMFGTWWYLRTRRKRKELEFRQQRAELRYNLLRAQMNPHFIFNSLNAIQNFFSGKRFAHGNEYLGTFSQLVRRILEQTGQAAISLQEEIDTLRLYLDLEQLRMGDKLTYRISVDPALETEIMDVPPLVLQPFVENAIWHGIGPKNGPGHIDIQISYREREDALHCVVQDDGVGMKTIGKEREHHRSRGVEITRSRLGKGGEIDIKDRSRMEPGHTGVRTELLIPLWD